MLRRTIRATFGLLAVSLALGLVLGGDSGRSRALALPGSVGDKTCLKCQCLTEVTAQLDHDEFRDLWEQALKGTQAHPTIADVDQDSEFEVLFTSQDGYLYCISANHGVDKWRFDTGVLMYQNQVIVADVNNDEEYEIIIWNDLGEVIILTFYGSEIGRWTHPWRDSIRMCQAMGDIDRDGFLELFPHLHGTDGAFAAMFCRNT